MKNKKVYIAGKITGLEDYKERFAQAENELTFMGATTMNPAVLPKGFEQDEYLHVCFSMIDVCDAIYFLDNWKNSPGAKAEFLYATDKKKEILFQATEPA